MLSRLTALLALLLIAPTVCSQTNLWSHVTTVYNPPTTPQAQLPDAEITAIRNLLRSPAQRDVWSCGEDPNADLANGAIFSTISLAPGHKTILVEAGSGCARGGQGSNGAMWIIEFHGSRPAVLASPKQNFGGWLYSVEPNPHSIYSDIVLGWHMSASEAGLSYFRFNGHSYTSIGSADLKFEGNEKGTLIPNPPEPSKR